MDSPKPLNFRQRFEAWHKAKYGYCEAPRPGFTALTVAYSNAVQQARWEGWQGNSDNSYQLGHNAGVQHHINVCLAASQGVPDGLL